MTGPKSLVSRVGQAGQAIRLPGRRPPACATLAVLTAFAIVTAAEEPAARPYWRTIVRGTHGMVAAEHPLEAMAGLDALKAGGNAIEAASNGHPLTEWAATNYAEAFLLLSKYPSSTRALLPGVKPPHFGDLFVQADLGHTLDTIAREGADVFYRGQLARMTADTYQKAGGVLRYEDLASFQAEQTDPIHTLYKGYDVYESAPNSQGIVLLIALNIVEGFDLKALGHNSPD